MLLPQAKAIISSPLLPLLFAAAYAVLAWQAWQGGSLALVQDVLHAAKPWPDASLLAAMFQDKAIAALAWLHLLMLDFLTARCGGGIAAVRWKRARVRTGLAGLHEACSSPHLCMLSWVLPLAPDLRRPLSQARSRSAQSPAVGQRNMWSRSVLHKPPAGPRRTADTPVLWLSGHCCASLLQGCVARRSAPACSNGPLSAAVLHGRTPGAAEPPGHASSGALAAQGRTRNGIQQHVELSKVFCDALTGPGWGGSKRKVLWWRKEESVVAWRPSASFVRGVLMACHAARLCVAVLGCPSASFLPVG